MADSVLNSVEDSMKEKYISLIRNTSHVELKKFNKNDYKKKILRDMSKQLPSYDRAELDGYAQCVSNTLNSEVQSLLKKRSRAQTPSKISEPSELSNTVLEALDDTMYPNNCTSSQTLLSEVTDTDGESDDDDDGDDENDTDHDQQTQNSLNDSVTKLKVCYSSRATEDINVTSLSTIHGVQPEKQGAADSDGRSICQSKPKIKPDIQKCCETCKMKTRPKKKKDEIQCSVCMTWYHEQCMGITNKDPVGIWSCLTCRQFPKTVTSELSALKADLNILKQ